MHYEVYIYHRERRSLVYVLTLRELDNQYVGLKRLENKYTNELSKERNKSVDGELKRASEELKRLFETLTFQVQRLVHLENEKKVKGEMDVEHIGDTC